MLLASQSEQTYREITQQILLSSNKINRKNKYNNNDNNTKKQPRRQVSRVRAQPQGTRAVAASPPGCSDPHSTHTHRDKQHPPENTNTRLLVLALIMRHGPIASACARVVLPTTLDRSLLGAHVEHPTPASLVSGAFLGSSLKVSALAQRAYVISCSTGSVSASRCWIRLRSSSSCSLSSSFSAWMSSRRWRSSNRCVCASLRAWRGGGEGGGEGGGKGGFWVW